MSRASLKKYFLCQNTFFDDSDDSSDKSDYMETGQYKMQTTDCRLGLKCRLGTKLKTGFKMKTES